jgi:cohesin complex subunit SA-1/2
MSAAVSTSGVTEVASSDARRRSGRVVRKPEKLASAPSPSGSAKRKRRDNDDSGVEAGESTSEEQSDSSEGEPDEEEMRERQRKRKGKGAAKRPAPKKPKTNGAPISLAMRPAAGASRKLSKRPRKAAIRKSAISEEEAEGLYGMLLMHRGTRDLLTTRSRRFRERKSARGCGNQLGRPLQRTRGKSCGRDCESGAACCWL